MADTTTATMSKEKTVAQVRLRFFSDVYSAVAVFTLTLCIARHVVSAEPDKRETEHPAHVSSCIVIAQVGAVH